MNGMTAKIRMYAYSIFSIVPYNRAEGAHFCFVENRLFLFALFIVMSLSEHIDKNFTEICSERTIFSEQQGFFGEMFEIVRNCCPEKWLKNKFEALSSDSDKLRLLFDEPNVSDMLLGTLENVAAVYRKKDSAFSRQRRISGEKLHEEKDFDNALILLTHAIARAPSKGDTIYNSYKSKIK